MSPPAKKIYLLLLHRDAPSSRSNTWDSDIEIENTWGGECFTVIAYYYKGVSMLFRGPEGDVNGTAQVMGISDSEMGEQVRDRLLLMPKWKTFGLVMGFL